MKDPTEAHEAVRMLKNRGVDFVKVQDALPASIYTAVADAARRERIPLAGHIPPTVRVSDVVRAGQASVEHLGGQFFGVLAGCSREEARIVERATNLYRTALADVEKDRSPKRRT